METQNNFILNDAFKKNAKVYQTKPVLATKYKPGMETGFAVYICNQTTEKKSKKNFNQTHPPFLFHLLLV